MLTAFLSAMIHLNEIRVDSLPPFTDIEYVELSGDPGASLSGLSVACVDQDGVLTGFVPLSGSIDPDGFSVVSGSVSMPNVDLISDLGLPDSKNLTVFLLVDTPYMVPGNVVDNDHDGSLDVSWEIQDSLAIRWGEHGHVYSPNVIGDGNGIVIFGARKCPDSGDWSLLPSVFGYTVETPHAANPPCTGTIGCEGDIDGDGQVDATDLAFLLGSLGGSFPPADLDHDGTVTQEDLAILLGSWGACNPTT